MHFVYQPWLLGNRYHHLEAVSMARKHGGKIPTSWPTSLAIHDVDCIQTTADFLDVTNGLLNIIKVRGSGVADILALPVGEGVCKPGIKVSISFVSSCKSNSQQLDTSCNERICRTVRIFIPAVCGTDCDVRKHALNLLNHAQQLRCSQAPSIESL